MASALVASTETSVREPGPPGAFAVNPFKDELIATCKAIATPGKGILASDESDANIGRKFGSIGLENIPENRRRYREVLYSTPNLSDYISGVILNSETINMSNSEGTPFPLLLQMQGVVPGIKVDQGVKDFPYLPGDVYTQGITDLDKIAKEAYEKGARFAKWRCVLKIQDGRIPLASIQETSLRLAQYASLCQVNGLAPIVEPEILMDGSHSLKIQQYWSEKVWSAVYAALIRFEVILEGTLLKPSMCAPGNTYEGKRDFKANALATVTAMKRCVPAAIGGITFLSGGLSEEEATVLLNEINQFRSQLPWSVSFSFGRALQTSCVAAWQGKDELKGAAQEALLRRAKANGQAQLGKYDGWAADETAKKSLFEKGYSY